MTRNERERAKALPFSLLRPHTPSTLRPMPLPTTSPKLNTGITIDSKIKALADLVATHERRTFASLVEHAIWLYVQKRLPTEEVERVLLLLSQTKGPAGASSKSRSNSKARGARAALAEAPVPVLRREKSSGKDKAAPKPKALPKAKPGKKLSKAKAKGK